MHTIRDIYAIALVLLFVFGTHGIVKTLDIEDEVKAEEHAQWLAEKYEREHGPAMHEEIRQLRMELRYAEFRDKNEKIKP